jgi:hypothetical protein
MQVAHLFKDNYMPYTPSQHRLFQAAAHDASIAKRVGIPQDKAAMMASEGVKKDPKKLAAALMK